MEKEEKKTNQTLSMAGSESKPGLGQTKPEPSTVWLAVWSGPKPEKPSLGQARRTAA